MVAKPLVLPVGCMDGRLDPVHIGKGVIHANGLVLKGGIDQISTRDGKGVRRWIGVGRLMRFQQAVPQSQFRDHLLHVQHVWWMDGGIITQCLRVEISHDESGCTVCYVGLQELS